MTWEVFVTVRIGTYRVREVNVTPALGMLAIVGAFFLMLHDPSWR